MGKLIPLPYCPTCMRPRRKKGKCRACDSTVPARVPQRRPGEIVTLYAADRTLQIRISEAAKYPSVLPPRPLLVPIPAHRGLKQRRWGWRLWSPD
ncbi:MAG: hypothetical protein ACYTG0_33455 [Planctomycetota bacterium]|jgi:hypothetical protein